MRYVMLVLVMMVFLGNAYSQEVYIYDNWGLLEEQQYDYNYDIKWVVVSVDSFNLGDEDCEHEWVYSKEWRAGGNMGCLVMHHGGHCSWDESMRDRICEKCLRKERQREVWYLISWEEIITKEERRYNELEEKLD